MKKLIFISLLLTASISGQLKVPENQADYLIIMDDKFAEPLSKLIDFRTSQGLNLKLVDIDDVYSEFKDTLSNQETVREFVSYALENWQEPKPKYLLLAGDTEIIPSYIVKSSFADTDYDEDSVAIDEFFGINKYQEDEILDIAVGRFPVKTPGEMQNIVDKTIRVEDTLAQSNYPLDVLLLADGADLDGSIFLAQSQNLREDLFQNYDSELIYFNDPLNTRIKKDTLFQLLNSGSFFLNYFGHGRSDIWSRSNILSIDDISRFTGELPATFLSSACKQNFNITADSVIVEKLLKMEQGGIVSAVVSSGLNYAGNGYNFVSSFYDKIFSNPELTMGEIFLKVKEAKTNDIDKRMTLLGDPALKLPLDLILGTDEPASDIPESFALAQNYPNPFNPTTMIVFRIPKSAKVELKIYDLIGKEAATLVNETIPAGEHEVIFNANKLSSGVYFYQLKAGEFIQTKKMLLLR